MTYDEWMQYVETQLANVRCQRMAQVETVKLQNVRTINPLREQVAEMLADGPMTAHEIASETGASSNGVRCVLATNPEFVKAGTTQRSSTNPATLWSLNEASSQLLRTTNHNDAREEAHIRDAV